MSERMVAFDDAVKSTGALRRMTISLLLVTVVLLVTFRALAGTALTARTGEWLLYVTFFTALGLVHWLHRDRIRCGLRHQLAQRGIPVCVRCGYDLRGDVHPRCPECGEPPGDEIRRALLNERAKALRRTTPVPPFWHGEEFQRDMAGVKALIQNAACLHLPAVQRIRRVRGSGTAEPATGSAVCAQLDNLLGKYPGHPELLTQRGLSENDPLTAIAFFRQAIASSDEHGLPCPETRLALAETLAEHLKRFDEARAELERAQPEVKQAGDAFALEWLQNVQATVDQRYGSRCKCGATLGNLDRPECPTCGCALS